MNAIEICAVKDMANIYIQQQQLLAWSSCRRRRRRPKANITPLLIKDPIRVITFHQAPAERARGQRSDAAAAAAEEQRKRIIG